MPEEMTPFTWFRQFVPPIEKIPLFSRKWVRAWYTIWSGVEVQGWGCAISMCLHYCDVIMDTMALKITSLTIVYSSVYSGANQRKHQSFASLAFVRAIHRLPVNSPRKGPVMRKMFPFDEFIMSNCDSNVHCSVCYSSRDHICSPANVTSYTEMYEQDKYICFNNE